MDTFEIPLGIAEVKVEKVETTEEGGFVINERSPITFIIVITVDS